MTTEEIKRCFVFWGRVHIQPGCWRWRAAKDTSGYGRFLVNGKAVAAHRHAYEMMVGPIPEGLQLDHLCRNRWCCNPSHLEPVTKRENILRGVGASAKAARATHCPSGHPLSGDNLYINYKGARCCRACMRATAHRRYIKKKLNNLFSALVLILSRTPTQGGKSTWEKKQPKPLKSSDV